MIKLLHGDCLELMKEIEPGSVDMVLTDPPYSSGGLYAGDRKADTRNKYTAKEYNGAAAFPSFFGDNMDQKAFMGFIRQFASSCRRTLKSGGIAAIFTDWRQISAVIDSIQMGGIVFRGIISWDKGNSRNTPQRFRNDCEYIVWGTNGPRDAKHVKGMKAYPGCYHIPGMNTRIKHHQTEKPIELLSRLVDIIPVGGNT